MDGSEKQKGSHLFLVRLWLDQEDGASAQGIWCGKVQHVVSGRAAYFDGHGSLVQALLSMMPGAGASSVAAPDEESRRPD